MQKVIEKFERLLAENLDYFKTTAISILEEKISEEKWSKKEILGHLIDSSIHNLVRFTEINYSGKLYIYRTYNQNDLVKINQYQEMNIGELVQLWFSINNQILRLFKTVTEEALEYKIQLTDNSTIDLRFLMTDYVEHLEHHINQIRNN
jgi:hypothetical protein